MNTKLLKWVNTAAFVVMVVVNFLANLLPLGIGTTAEISNMYPSLFTPAGYTFSIWGLIYILLAIFVAYSWGKNGEDITEKIGPYFAISCILNSAWIFFWHYNNMLLSEILIFCLLISLLMVQRQYSTIYNVKKTEKLIGIAFDIYTGWIIAASIANTSVLLVSLGWKGMGLSPVVWTCIILIVGAAIGSLPSIINYNSFSTLAVMWAYVGILVKHMSTNELNGQYPIIVSFCISGIIIMALVLVYYVFVRSHERNTWDRLVRET